MIHSYRCLTAVCSTLVFGLCAAPQATAQSLFVTSNRTVAGGNPINGSYNQITIGYDGVSTAFPGVQADITGGSATGYINATNQSLVNITGGTFGTVPSGGTYAAALTVQGGSTVNLSGGTFNSFATIGQYGGSGPLNTFNLSGGVIPSVYVYDNSVVNMTGGSITTIPGSAVTRGALVNARNGTINLSGGTVASVELYGIAYQPSAFGTINVSGGTIGSITASGNGFLNFQGSNFNVSAGAQYAKYDVSYGINSLVRDYTVTGALNSGQAINQTFTAATDYTATSSLLNFRGTFATLAQDLYVQTDQTVSGVYNFVEIGYDESSSTPSSPSVTIATGTNAANVESDNDSTVQMTGGEVHGAVLAGGTSHVTITGGTIGNTDDSASGIYGFDNSTVSVLGGIATSVQGYDNSQVTVGGTAQVGLAIVENSSFLITGGTVQTVQIGAYKDSASLSLLGGAVGRVEGYGGTANVLGGLVDGAILANIGVALGYSGTDFNLYGTNLSVVNAVQGTYIGYGGDNNGYTDGLSGVWWDLSGTLADGSRLSARYFEADGSTTAPARLNLITAAAAPEPSSLALLGFLLPLAVVTRRLKYKCHVSR